MCRCTSISISISISLYIYIYTYTFTYCDTCDIMHTRACFALRSKERAAFAVAPQGGVGRRPCKSSYAMLFRVMYYICRVMYYIYMYILFRVMFLYRVMYRVMFRAESNVLYS